MVIPHYSRVHVRNLLNNAGYISSAAFAMLRYYFKTPNGQQITIIFHHRLYQQYHFHCPASVSKIALLLQAYFKTVKRYFTEIAFLGTDFFGWQTQPRERNVQDTITKALQIVLQQPDIKIVGCGRTDTGVHASQYYFHFDSESTIEEPAKLLYKLNRMLSQSIAVKHIFKVDNGLHARFDAIYRTYQYHINYLKNPFKEATSWHHNRQLDAAKMNEAASMLLKHADFAAFSKTGGDNKTTRCKISRANWQQNENELLFTITADRFLRNMVRAIVGTLVEVGMGNISLSGFESIIESKSRGRAGMSAPAKGLFLTAVKYPQIND